jgi:uncharacterized RDD family membrane protein YckC
LELATDRPPFSFAFGAAYGTNGAFSGQQTQAKPKHLTTMKWYYVDNGQQAGPVEETEFPQLVRSGKLRSDTLVWREGLANWEPFSTACPNEFSASNAGVSGVGPEAVCAECGGLFNKDDMIPAGNAHICAKCKPVYMQKMAEGLTVNTGALNYAGVLTRFGAVFLDGIILWIVQFGLQMLILVGIGTTAGSNPELAITMQFVLMFVSLAIGVCYETLMIGKFGATLGKMACKIKVVTADGGRVTYLRALGRYFSKMLSGLICAIGYFMALFDKEEKRTLHDRICNTRVVMK